MDACGRWKRWAFLAALLPMLLLHVCGRATPFWPSTFGLAHCACDALYMCNDVHILTDTIAHMHIHMQYMQCIYAMGEEEEEGKTEENKARDKEEIRN